VPGRSFARFLAARLMQQIESRVSAFDMDTLVDRIAARTIDPYAAADHVLGAGGLKEPRSQS
jgi:hypothetical protein